MSSYIQFGAGKLFVNPNAGNLAVNPTPVQGKTIQDVTIDAASELKELKGASQYPDDVAAADRKTTGKFSIGRKDLTFFNQVFFADAVAAGGTSVVPNFAAVPSSNAVTVTPPNSGTFGTDLGVQYQGSGLSLTRIPSGTPAAGQYTCASGVYTFASGDTSAAAGVLISYAYSLASLGATYTVNNQDLGYGPQCELYLVDTYQPNNSGSASNPVLEYNCIRLYAVKFTKLTLGNKRSDYAMPELEFSYFQNSAGKVMDMYSVKG